MVNTIINELTIIINKAQPCIKIRWYKDSEFEFEISIWHLVNAHWLNRYISPAFSKSRRVIAIHNSQIEIEIACSVRNTAY